ncbi:MAG: NUDIX hydrolase [Clostridiales bacterium]|nr:NUDIX hydrolase [Clostridiales bacterium]
MEIWDLYDREGNKTGEVWERQHGNYLAIPDGLYHIVSDILVKHVDGTYLLTKRHPEKDVYPGYWEASAGGSAQQGEDPKQCAIRELFEETGLVPDSIKQINKTIRDKSHSIIFSYLAVVSGDKDAVVLQDGETTEYRWVDVKGLLEYTRSDLAITTHVERYRSYLDSIFEDIR